MRRPHVYRIGIFLVLLPSGARAEERDRWAGRHRVWVRRLRQGLADDFGFVGHAGQPVIEPLVEIAQLGMIQAHQM